MGAQSESGYPAYSLSDIEAVRALFPVTRKHVYLNNAAQSPLCANVRAAVDDYLDFSSEDLPNRPSVRDPIRDLLAELFGGQSCDYAMMTSTGAGISTVAAGFEWAAGDNVLLPAGEHWNSTFPWLNLNKIGVETRIIPLGADGRVQIDDFAAQIDRNTRIICVTAVRFDNGFRADLKRLSELAVHHDALLVVDGTQCAGASTINVLDDGVDVLACAGFKWLLGLAGTGFLYVNERARSRISPVSPGMFAAAHKFTEIDYHDDARRYETGTLAYALFHGWAAGLKLLADLGIDNIATRNLQLTDRLVAGLVDAKVEVRSPVERTGERSAIVTFSAGSVADNTAVFERLDAARVQVSLRGTGLRVSPNFLNTDDEIDRLLSVL